MDILLVSELIEIMLKLFIKEISLDKSLNESKLLFEDELIFTNLFIWEIRSFSMVSLGNFDLKTSES